MIAQLIKKTIIEHPARFYARPATIIPPLIYNGTASQHAQTLAQLSVRPIDCSTGWGASKIKSTARLIRPESHGKIRTPIQVSRLGTSGIIKTAVHVPNIYYSVGAAGVICACVFFITTATGPPSPPHRPQQNCTRIGLHISHLAPTCAKTETSTTCCPARGSTGVSTSEIQFLSCPSARPADEITHQA